MGACSSVKMMMGYMLIWWSAEGVHFYLSECWRSGKRKVWGPL